jgi:hypothetical protein
MATDVPAWDTRATSFADGSVRLNKLDFSPLGATGASKCAAGIR